MHDLKNVMYDMIFGKHDFSLILSMYDTYIYDICYLCMHMHLRWDCVYGGSVSRYIYAIFGGTITHISVNGNKSPNKLAAKL